MTGNPKIKEKMAVVAGEARRALAQQGKTGQTIHLLHFTQREEIEEW